MYSLLNDSLDLPKSALRQLERLRGAVAAELTLVALQGGRAGLVRHLDREAFVDRALEQRWSTATALALG